MDTSEADSGKSASRAHAHVFSDKKINISDKDISKEKSKKKKDYFDHLAWLELYSEDPWKGVLRLWLEYKAERGEHYSGAISLARLASHLKNISGGNPAVAQQIVDRSIACSWKGLFPLDRAFGAITAAPSASTPQTGQRIGQIMQPRSEAERNSILEKFNNKAAASKKNITDKNH